MSVKDSYSPPINTRKILVGIILAAIVIMGFLYFITRPSKENLVGSSIQITQPNTPTASLAGYEPGYLIVTDTFYMKKDSLPAAIVYRDTTSTDIKQVNGYIINMGYYSKGAGMKLVQTIPTYFYKGKSIRANLVITSQLVPN